MFCRSNEAYAKKVNKMKRKELQAECKKNGIKAAGKGTSNDELKAALINLRERGGKGGVANILPGWNKFLSGKPSENDIRHDMTCAKLKEWFHKEGISPIPKLKADQIEKLCEHYGYKKSGKKKAQALYDAHNRNAKARLGRAAFNYSNATVAPKMKKAKNSRKRLKTYDTIAKGKASGDKIFLNKQGKVYNKQGKKIAASIDEWSG